MAMIGNWSTVALSWIGKDYNQAHLYGGMEEPDKKLDNAKKKVVRLG